jgi:hypothetical protein
MSRSSATVTGERTEEEGTMRAVWLPAVLLLIPASTSTTWAEPGFDEKYQRDFNIFNPINQYQPANPLNPINAYDPTNPFNPINQYDPDNPANPINQFNPNNPFNPINRYRPEDPLNPINEFNPNVPFAPLGGPGQKR